MQLVDLGLQDHIIVSDLPLSLLDIILDAFKEAVTFQECSNELLLLNFKRVSL